MHSFPPAFRRYDLHSRLVDRACAIACEEGIISQGLLDKFVGFDDTNVSEESAADSLLNSAMQFRTSDDIEKKIGCFETMKKKAKLTPKEQTQLGTLMNILVPLLNAANSVKENMQQNSSPDQLFHSYLSAGLNTIKDGKNYFGMEPEVWLDALAAAKDKLILSLVNTAHPTNFHTPFGRAYEKKLITTLKAVGAEKTQMISDQAMVPIEAEIRNTCRHLQKGESITYVQKVTVGEETETEKDILKVQKSAMAHVLSSWNTALSDVMTTAPARIKERLEKLRLSDTDKKRIYEQRTWIRAGADKDGRDESTDIAFYAGYKDSLDNEGVYQGPILDLRDNAEVRKKLIGALIAQRYQRDLKGNFRQACNEYCEHPVEPLPEGFNPRTSPFQLLSEKNQTAFLQYLMDKGLPVMNVDAVKTEAIGFNEKFYEVYRDLLKELGLNKHTPIYELSGDNYKKLLARMSAIKGELQFGENRDSVKGGYAISSVYEHLDDTRQASAEGYLEPAVVGINYNHSKFGNPLIFGQPTVTKSRNVRDINGQEVLSCMAYLRRLFLVNQFVDDQQGKAVVAEREQAANFENASDFFAQLYLFQQAGLVTMGEADKGTHPHREVTAVKVGIQPLFETTPEMSRAPDIIDEILKSPLGESYYRVRGKAEFMVGYSDSAKSGGNFASHVRIREFERMVTQKFKDKFGPDFDVRILRGPGRGENRGGTRRYDRQHMLHHDDVNASAVNDQTVQGDLPVRMEMNPAFAERTIGEMMVSTLAGFVESKREKSTLEQERLKRFEAAVNFIADHSEEHYRKGIFVKEQEADALIRGVINNPDASSRRLVRGNTEQKGIGPLRAITVEYATGIAGLPLHDYGLKDALNEYIQSGPAVLDRQGREVTGREALEIMAQDFAFFRQEMKLAVLRQQNFNPVLADCWAKKSGQEQFVDDIKSHLSGLGDMCQSVIRRDKKAEAPSREAYAGEPLTSALSDVVQAVLAANQTVDPTTAKTLYFPLQAPVSEKPAGRLRSRVPGLDVALSHSRNL